MLRAGMSASVTVDTGHVRGVPDSLKPAVAALGLDPYLPTGTAVAATSDTASSARTASTDADTATSK